MSLSSILTELEVSSCFITKHEISSSFTLCTDSSIDNYQRTSLTKESEISVREPCTVCRDTKQGTMLLPRRDNPGTIQGAKK